MFSRFCNKTNYDFRICTYIYIYNHGWEGWIIYYFFNRNNESNRINRCIRSNGCKYIQLFNLPKVVAMTIYPFIIVISMFLEFLVIFCLCDWRIYYTLILLTVYNLTCSISSSLCFRQDISICNDFSHSFLWFFMKGGALEVGKASTTSFVWTSVAIIIMNSFVTNLLLT